MKCIIIDDEAPIRDGLQLALEKVCPFLEIVGSAETCQKAFELVSEKNPDLVFLDIEMPDETGFDFLLRFKEVPFEIIFVTGYDSYAIKAIKCSAVDYLLKPVDELELVQAVNKVQHRLNTKQANHNSVFINNLKNPNQQTNRIAIPKANGYEFIPVEEIVSCEGDGDNTKIHLSDKTSVYATKSLKNLLLILEDYNFSRIHQSHIINLHKMKRYFKGEGGYVKMVDETIVNVSRRRKREFLDKLKALNMI